MNTFFELLDQKPQNTIDPVTRRKDVARHLNALEDLVNNFSFSPKTTCLELSEADDEAALKRELVTWAVAAVFFYGTAVTGYMIDARNALCVKRCAETVSLPAFKKLCERYGFPENNPSASYWRLFADRMGTHMHRTNAQTSIGFAFFILKENADRTYWESIEKHLIENHGEHYYCFPMI